MVGGLVCAEKKELQSSSTSARSEAVAANLRLDELDRSMTTPEG